ncbi:MAG TPA: TetR/AcrR family transcriptional regulator [Stackebrandtia sp.]|nr:TetR/AcrR family transcriptional regulator [Stackebrandtia sp.]HZE38593.1 TetR/AcrR family transcriptional regulator [Stackebrandtia sp.]
MDRRRSRGDERRAEILDAALETFAEKGFRGASLAAIAERVGLTQQGLLHYFPSKEELLVEVLKLRDERDTDALGDNADGSTMSLNALSTLVEVNAGRRGIVQSFTVLSADSVTDDHPARDYFVDRYRRVRRKFAAVVAAECGDQLPSGMDPEQAATLIIAVMDGLQLQWLLSDGEVDMPALFRHFVALLRD